jgi:segregation and condensation protein A
MTAHLDDYRVELDAYSGPLDLLLFLVRRHEIDLYDIPVARLTEQYLEHLRKIEEIDVERAGDFLVMAATLLEIKSQMLVPQDTTGQGQQTDDATLDITDPRYELVQQLLAYKRFKDAAYELDERRRDWEARFPVKPAKREQPAGPEGEEGAQLLDVDLEDVQILDLCKAFARILDSIGQKKAHEITYDDTPIALHAEDIIDRLERDAPAGSGGMTLGQIFTGRSNRSELIGLFLAVLELVRQRRIRVGQDQLGGEVKLELRPPEEQTPSDEENPDRWKNPQTGQIEYDWPSEDARLRAARRAKLRGQRLKRMHAGEDISGEEDEIIDVDEDAGEGNDEEQNANDE